MSLRIAALGLLAREPGSGYDLLKHFKTSMANVWPATQSQLYAELNTLADARLIEVTDVGPRGRKGYRITDTGRAELQLWVSQPQGDNPFRNPRLLRVFLLGEVPSDQARDHVAAMALHARSEVRRLEMLRDSTDCSASDEDGAFYGRAALEFGLRINAVNAEWTEWLTNAMDARRGPP